GSKYSDKEWYEYIEMLQVHNNETSSEWMKQILLHLLYFKKNNLLPIESKKYLEARRLIRLLNGGLYASEIRIAICFSCDQLVYTGQRKKNIENYNHIGIERYWKFSYTGNKYYGINYEEYLKIKQKSNSEYDYNSKYTLYQYGL
ncbi:22805_t:CDS:1, partial [Racocetra persica]